MADRPRATSRSIARIDSPAREGLTGTTPASVYRPLRDAEQITIAPDGAATGRAAALAQGFSDRLAAGPLRRAPRLHEVHGADQPRVHRRPGLDRRDRTGCAGAAASPTDASDRLARRRCRSARAMSSPIPDEHDRLRAGPHRRRTTFVAYSQKCTHLSCAVVPQRRRRRASAARATRASSISQPGRPIAGPPRRPLPRIRLEVRGDDVYATGVEERTV